MLKIEGNLVSGLLSLTGRTIAHFVTSFDMIFSQHWFLKIIYCPTGYQVLVSYRVLTVTCLPDCIKIGSDSASRSIKSISSSAAAIAIEKQKQGASILHLCLSFLELRVFHQLLVFE